MPDFQTSTRWMHGTLSEVQPTDGPALTVSSPAAFGGEGNHWTPEDLLLGAAESCLLQTFLFFVRRQKLELLGWQSRAEAKMEKTPNGLRVAAIMLRVQLQASSAEEAGRLRTTVQQAERYCPVSNALQVPVHLEIETEPAVSSSRSDG